LSQCLLSSTERENRLHEASASIDARSNGGKLRKLAQPKATSVMLTLLKDAKAAEIPAKYVLFDTWFCSPSSLLQVKDIGYDVIGMVKKSDKIHFRYNGRMQSAPTIFRASKKRRGRSPYLLSVKAEAVKGKQAIPIKLVFVRNRNNRQDYLIFLAWRCHNIHW
jgi:hypothetical protein